MRRVEVRLRKQHCGRGRAAHTHRDDEQTAAWREVDSSLTHTGRARLG
jgi:hypothetical protein